MTSALRKRCEDIAAEWADCGDSWRTCTQCAKSVARRADEMEAEAKRFAEAALRDAICEWNVINCGDQAWCNKRIAEAIKAAEGAEE